MESYLFSMPLLFFVMFYFFYVFCRVLKNSVRMDSQAAPPMYIFRSEKLLSLDPIRFHPLNDLSGLTRICIILCFF